METISIISLESHNDIFADESQEDIKVTLNWSKRPTIGDDMRDLKILPYELMSGNGSEMCIWYDG